MFWECFYYFTGKQDSILHCGSCMSQHFVVNLRRTPSSCGLVLSSPSISWSSSVRDLGAFTNELFIKVIRGAEWTDSVCNQDWFIWILTWDRSVSLSKGVYSPTVPSLNRCAISVFLSWVCGLRWRMSDALCLLCSSFDPSVSSLRDLLLMSGTCLSENVKTVCIIKVIIMMWVSV